MKAFALSAALILTALSLAACQSHPELRYAPESYAQLRHIELLTAEPGRPYELVAEVKGHGGRHTATSTLINAIIDEASKVGAQALIPVENADRGNTIQGLDQFVFTENGQTMTRGRAIRWVDYGTR